MTGLAAGELGGSDFAFAPLQLDKHGLKDRCLLRHKLLQIELLVRCHVRSVFIRLPEGRELIVWYRHFFRGTEPLRLELIFKRSREPVHIADGAAAKVSAS